MYKYLLAALLAAFVCSAKAQTPADSDYLDLGRFKIRKNLAQTVTLKGKELEQIPFANLTDAINVWLSGFYTNAGTVVYVVDGLVLNDVNAYSIHDIEEITLIQNSAAQLNGISGYQQLVLIQTKRKRDKPAGVTAAAQANAIDLTGNRGSSHHLNLFQQYYLSAYKSTANVTAGISANYLHDLIPESVPSASANYNALKLNRFRFNGYLNAKLSNASTLDITAGYVPQNNSQGFTDINSNSLVYASDTLKEHLFNAQLKLTTAFTPHLINTLKAGYNSFRELQQSLVNVNYYNLGIVPSQQSTTTINRDSSTLFVLIDQLSYHLTFGSWHIEPQVSYSYNHVHTSSYQTSANYAFSTESGPGHYDLLTPAFEAGYANAIDVQGGVLFELDNHLPANLSGNRPKKSFPFITAMVDIVQLAQAGQSAASVKLYGSYALSNPIYNASNSLSFFNFYQLSASYTAAGLTNYYSDPYTYNKTLNLGTTVGLLNNKLTLSYNFQRLAYAAGYFIPLPATANEGSSAFIPTDVRTYTHRAGIYYTFITGSDIHFSSGLNASLYRTAFPAFQDNVYGSGLSPYLTNTSSGYTAFNAAVAHTPVYIQGSKTYTGGWTNRFTYKHLLAGADVLYYFGNPVDVYNGSVYNSAIPGNLLKQHSVQLQNLFLGYQLHIQHVPDLQIFADARNLNGNKNNTLGDYRRYIGIGLKAGF